MLNKDALPPRMYYTLKQAAAEIGCDESYLLHLGATNRLELVIKSPNPVGAFSFKIGSGISLLCGDNRKPDITVSHAFLALSFVNIQTIENGGKDIEDMFSDAYLPEIDAKIHREDSEDLRKFKHAKTTGDFDYAIYAPLTYNTDPETSLQYPYTPTLLKYSPKTVLILQNELSRLIEGRPKSNTQALPPAKLIKGLENFNSQKAKAKETARVMAKAIWKVDSDKKLRIRHVADQIYRLLVDEGMATALPNDHEAVADWIREQAPDYAKRPGRPKTPQPQG